MKIASAFFSSIHRSAILVIGLSTAALSAWWLAAEISRSDPSIAASVGIVRGDLWLDQGLARSATSITSHTGVRPALERAARFSPANSEVWLALALASERFDWLDQRTAAALKMSYYTGFNTAALVAPRLQLLARTDSARDPELGDILRRQIRLIVTRASALNPAITQAYATATPANRQLIEAELRESQPDLLRLLVDK
jgi:hypothetical protein